MGAEKKDARRIAIVGAKKGVLFASVTRAILFVLFLAIVYYVIFMLPLRMAGSGAEGVWLPIVVTSSLLFISSILAVVMAGDIVPSIRAIISQSAFIFFILYIIVLSSEKTSSLSQLFFPVLLTGISVVARIPARLISRYAEIIVRAFVLLTLGLLLGSLLSAMGLDPSGSGIMLYSFMVTAAISLLGLLYQSEGSWIRSLGEYFERTSGVLMAIMVSLVSLTYVMIGRPYLARGDAEISQVIDWGAVALVTGYVSLRIFLYFRSEGKKQTMSDWGKLVQTITYEKGKIQLTKQPFVHFIEKGSKGPLIVEIVVMLRDQKINDQSISEAISDILVYQDPQIPLGFRWLIGEDRDIYRKAREKAVLRSLVKVASTMNVGYLVHEAESLDNRSEKKEEGALET